LIYKESSDSLFFYFWGIWAAPLEGRGCDFGRNFGNHNENKTVIKNMDVANRNLRKGAKGAQLSEHR
jgi:hypothetical protein